MEKSNKIAAAAALALFACFSSAECMQEEMVRSEYMTKMSKDIAARKHTMRTNEGKEIMILGRKHRELTTTHNVLKHALYKGILYEVSFLNSLSKCYLKKDKVLSEIYEHLPSMKEKNIVKIMQQIFLGTDKHFFNCIIAPGTTGSMLMLTANFMQRGNVLGQVLLIAEEERPEIGINIYGHFEDHDVKFTATHTGVVITNALAATYSKRSYMTVLPAPYGVICHAAGCWNKN
ncbi:hypothetical protein FACS1894122_05740 [Alphaproteobacteria bacterium]|nr:hypothetical protein FACS1894122_05740 [Alphaproteobacteria bacterium]